MPSFDPVTALVRGLDVLRLINQLDRATVTEIHRHTGIPKPTVLRMIETLMSAGYVARVDGGATYMATGRCLLLSNGLHAQARIAAVAMPLLNGFRRRIGWPSDFGVFDGDAMVIAATSREFGVLSLNRKVGARTPMLLSALGRAYLAFAAREERARILAVLANTANPFDAAAKRPNTVNRMLDETRSRGYSLTDENYLDTVYDGLIWGIGVPVLAGGRVMAAINVMFLRSALSLEQGLVNLLPPLKQAADEIGAELARDSLGLSAAV